MYQIPSVFTVNNVTLIFTADLYYKLRSIGLIYHSLRFLCCKNAFDMSCRYYLYTIKPRARTIFHFLWWMEFPKRVISVKFAPWNNNEKQESLYAYSIMKRNIVYAFKTTWGLTMCWDIVVSLRFDFNNV